MDIDAFKIVLENIESNKLHYLDKNNFLNQNCFFDELEKKYEFLMKNLSPNKKDYFQWVENIKSLNHFDIVNYQLINSLSIRFNHELLQNSKKSINNYHKNPYFWLRIVEDLKKNIKKKKDFFIYLKDLKNYGLKEKDVLFKIPLYKYKNTFFFLKYHLFHLISIENEILDKKIFHNYIKKFHKIIDPIINQSKILVSHFLDQIKTHPICILTKKDICNFNFINTPTNNNNKKLFDERSTPYIIDYIEKKLKYLKTKEKEIFCFILSYYIHKFCKKIYSNIYYYKELCNFFEEGLYLLTENEIIHIKDKKDIFSIINLNFL